MMNAVFGVLVGLLLSDAISSLLELLLKREQRRRILYLLREIRRQRRLQRGHLRLVREDSP